MQKKSNTKGLLFLLLGLGCGGTLAYSNIATHAWNNARENMYHAMAAINFDHTGIHCRKPLTSLVYTCTATVEGENIQQVAYCSGQRYAGCDLKQND